MTVDLLPIVLADLMEGSNSVRAAIGHARFDDERR